MEHFRVRPDMTAPAAMKSLNVIASSTEMHIFPPAGQAQSLQKAISSVGLESIWQLWGKKCLSAMTFTS